MFVEFKNLQFYRVRSDSSEISRRSQLVEPEAAQPSVGILDGDQGREGVISDL